MHVCVFTTAHPWDDVRVKSKFVDSFLDAGDTVTWIGPDRAFFESANHRDERVDFQLVTAVPGWRGRLASMGQLRDRLQKLDNVDWVYCPDPDAAALAMTVRGRKILFDIHEEYHKGHLAQAVPASMRRASEASVRAAMRMIVRRCSLVTSVNDAILEGYGARPGRSLATFNTPPSWFSDHASAQPGMRSSTTFFHGKALAGNGTTIVVDAVAAVRARGVDARVMVFPSPGAVTDAPYDPTFAARAAQPGLRDALDLRPGQPHRSMPGVMTDADVGLIAYDRTLAVGSLPNRFFEYLALGMPVIVPKYAPLMTEIVKAHELGVTADFEDADSVADAMQWMVKRPDEMAAMGDRARRVFREKYAWLPIFAALHDRMTGS